MVFFFNDTATTEIYTLSLHDALPILPSRSDSARGVVALVCHDPETTRQLDDRHSTRLNSSHDQISDAASCLPASGGPASGGPASGGPASGGPASGGPASGGPASGGPA